MNILFRVGDFSPTLFFMDNKEVIKINYNNIANELLKSIHLMTDRKISSSSITSIGIAEISSVLDEETNEYKIIYSGIEYFGYSIGGEAFYEKEKVLILVPSGDATNKILILSRASQSPENLGTSKTVTLEDLNAVNEELASISNSLSDKNKTFYNTTEDAPFPEAPGDMWFTPDGSSFLSEEVFYIEDVDYEIQYSSKEISSIVTTYTGRTANLVSLIDGLAQIVLDSSGSHQFAVGNEFVISESTISELNGIYTVSSVGTGPDTITFEYYGDTSNFGSFTASVYLSDSPRYLATATLSTSGTFSGGEKIVIDGETESLHKGTHIIKPVSPPGPTSSISWDSYVSEEYLDVDPDMVDLAVYHDLSTRVYFSISPPPISVPPAEGEVEFSFASDVPGTEDYVSVANLTEPLPFEGTWKVASKGYRVSEFSIEEVGTGYSYDPDYPTYYSIAVTSSGIAPEKPPLVDVTISSEGEISEIFIREGGYISSPSSIVEGTIFDVTIGSNSTGKLKVEKLDYYFSYDAEVATEPILPDFNNDGIPDILEKKIELYDGENTKVYMWNNLKVAATPVSYELVLSGAIQNSPNTVSIGGLTVDGTGYYSNKAKIQSITASAYKITGSTRESFSGTIKFSPYNQDGELGTVQQTIGSSGTYALANPVYSETTIKTLQCLSSIKIELISGDTLDTLITKIIPITFIPSFVTSWDGTRTEVGNTYVVTPQLFAGTGGPSPTGVLIGKDITTGIETTILTTGIAGFNSGTRTFYLDVEGNLTIGTESSGQLKYTDGMLSIPAAKVTGTLSAATITANNISGGTLTLGGINDSSGKISIYDDTGLNETGRINNGAIFLYGKGRPAGSSSRVYQNSRTLPDTADYGLSLYHETGSTPNNDALITIGGAGGSLGLITFGTAPAGSDSQTRMVINKDGYVGIGIVTPSTQLHINTYNADYAIAIQASNVSGNYYKMGVVDNSNNFAFSFYTPSLTTPIAKMEPSGVFRVMNRLVIEDTIQKTDVSGFMQFVYSNTSNNGLYFTKGTYAALSHIIQGSAHNTMSLDSSGLYYQVPSIYARTTSSAANVFVSTAGTLVRSTSATKYKIDIEPKSTDDRILQLQPKTWYDKHEVETNAEILTKEYEGEILEVADTPYIERHAGLIAEDLLEAGLGEYVAYGPSDEQGNREVEGIQYDRLWVELIPIIKKQQEEIENLKKEFLKIQKSIG